MRPTLHDYVINRFETTLRIEHFATAFRQCYDFAKITNSSPRLGDFVPCDEDGDVMDEPIDTIGGVEFYAKRYQAAQDRVIFAGDWEVFDEIAEHYIFLKSKGIILQWKISVQRFINERGQSINRIEDLPRQIEFKDGLI